MFIGHKIGPAFPTADLRDSICIFHWVPQSAELPQGGEFNTHWADIPHNSQLKDINDEEPRQFHISIKDLNRC